MKHYLENFKKNKPGVYQAIKYALLGLVASAVELASFSLFNYLVFGALKERSFSWFIFSYTADNGGLCYFLSLSVSFVLAQSVNFIIQRKITFHADNNAAKSAVMFWIMMLGVFILQMWLPCVLRSPFASIMNESSAELVIKLLCMFIGFVITYPLNKYVIMRKK